VAIGVGMMASGIGWRHGFVPAYWKGWKVGWRLWLSRDHQFMGISQPPWGQQPLITGYGTNTGWLAREDAACWVDHAKCGTAAEHGQLGSLWGDEVEEAAGVW
jgi:hypothetical protein